jgi:hypothetical protein
MCTPGKPSGSPKEESATGRPASCTASDRRATRVLRRRSDDVRVRPSSDLAGSRGAAVTLDEAARTVDARRAGRYRSAPVGRSCQKRGRASDASAVGTGQVGSGGVRVAWPVKLQHAGRGPPFVPAPRMRSERMWRKDQRCSLSQPGDQHVRAVVHHTDRGHQPRQIVEHLAPIHYQPRSEHRHRRNLSDDYVRSGVCRLCARGTAEPAIRTR